MASESNKRKLDDISTENIENFASENSTSMTTLEDTVFQQISDLHNDIHARAGIIQRLEEVEAGFADLTGDYAILKAENEKLKEDYLQIKADTSDLKNENQLMKAIIIAKDKEIQQLKTQISEQHTRNLQQNLLFHNVAETPNEDCLQTVKDILKKKTYLTEEMINSLSIEQAHRIGTINTQTQKKPRLLVITCSSSSDKALIQAAWNVKPQNRPPQPTSNKTFLPKVTSHLPPDILATRSVNIQMINNIKRKAGSQAINTKIVGQNAYVNNNLLKPLVTKPTVEELLNTETEERASMMKLPSQFSQVCIEKGSSFVAEAIKVRSVQQVRLAYKRALLDPTRTKATHNILAYKIGDDISWIDDGEYGAGRSLSTWMTKEKLDNWALIITRQYGGIHLGTRRYDIMRDMAREAVGLPKPL